MQLVDTENMKEFSNSCINQSKENVEAIQEMFSGNVKQLQRKNPLMSSQGPWLMAEYRRNIIHWFTLPLQISEEYWKTWAEVYRPPIDNKDERINL
jgi:hypothetical protein